MDRRVVQLARLCVLMLWIFAAASAEAAEKVKPRKGMKLPPELATGAVELKVVTHKHLVLPNKPVPLMLEFGAWKVTDFARGWISGAGGEAGVGSVAASSYEESQRYHFAVASMAAPETPPWTCRCEHSGTGGSVGQYEEHSELVIPTGGYGHLECDLRRGETGGDWHLDLRVRARPGWILAYEASGSVKSADRRLGIEGTDRYARTPGIGAQRLTGFVLTLDGRPIGAADLASPALLRVPDLPEELESPLAAAAAALLLFQDLTGHS